MLLTRKLLNTDSNDSLNDFLYLHTIFHQPVRNSLFYMYKWNHRYHDYIYGHILHY